MTPTRYPETILVVEDDRYVADLLEQLLQLFGYRVLLARDGREALELYWTRRSRISLILTDMMMPVMDGAALIHAVRERDGRVPILVLTATQPDEYSPTLQPLLDGWISKPPRAGQLVNEIRVALGGTAQQVAEA